MRETHYIDIDEEIISAVGRLRRSSQIENVFVFPKRALILQSIVNLRLLEREAKKLGKKIVVTTQDEAGKKLAERSGLNVEAYTDQRMVSPATIRPLSVSPNAGSQMVQSAPSQHAASSELGSNDFYTSSVPKEVPPVPPVRVNIAVPARPIRVRNASPTPLTTLNSMRGDVQRPLAQMPPVVHPPVITYPKETLMPPVIEPVSQQGRLGRFMGKNQISPKGHVATASEPRTTPLTSSRRKGTGFGWILPAGVTVCIAAIAYAGWYVFFPKVVITLQPQAAEQVVKIQVSAATISSDSGVLPARVISDEKTFQTKWMATGGAVANENSKARGTIRIYNNFSKESQSLVATTRFETPEGKIFRLLQSVVVPGISEKNGKTEAGMIEALVIADQVGANFNIGPTRFTIPGFKNGPKYEKFSAESLQKFTGGGEAADTTQKTVSLTDKDQAAQKALEEFRSHILTEIQQDLAATEVVLTDSIQIEKVSETTIPVVGSTATDFTYEGRYRVKIFVIDEQKVKERIESERVNTAGVVLVPKEYTFKYTSLLPKYDAGKIDMTIESTIQFEATIQTETIRQGLLGQDEAGIKEFLKLHPEIERLQVEFTPQLIVSTIPKNPDHVTIELRTVQD